jgi:hypothetical protein
MEHQESLSAAWAGYEALSGRLVRYLKTSEEEFASLIAALDACWNMAESVQKAGSRLAESTREAQDGRKVVRESMLEGCRIFKTILNQIEDASRGLASAEKETRELLGMANQLQTNLAPLQHIAFHFRLEASHLSAKDSSSVLTDYEEMRNALTCLKEAGDSQELTLITILDKLSATTQSVIQACTLFASRAAESEQEVERNIASLLEVPREMLRVQNKASALGTVLASGLRGAIEALQGHDAIRQRLEHIMKALGRLRTEQGDDPEHELLLERLQSKSVLDQIVSAGTRIERELNTVIGCARGIAGDDQASTSGDDEVTQFEKATDHIASLNSELSGLLAGGAKIGNLVVESIAPVRELLSANRDDLKTLAQAMRSMNLLAFNVLISADRMPSSRAIAALGAMTSEASESVLTLEKELTERFAGLGDALHTQAAAIAACLEGIESHRVELMDHRPDAAFRNSRRLQRAEVSRLSQEARQLKEATEALVQSLKFVHEGTKLLEELDRSIGSLLTLHPKSSKPFDFPAASAGYTMWEQHEVHDGVTGGTNAVQGRLTELGSQERSPDAITYRRR